MQRKCLDRGAFYRGGLPGSPEATQPPPRDRSAPGERCVSLGPVRAGAPQRGHSAADGACAHSKFPRLAEGDRNVLSRRGKRLGVATAPGTAARRLGRCPARLHHVLDYRRGWDRQGAWQAGR